MLTDGRIGRPEKLREVVKALRAGGLIAADVLSDLCRAWVVTSISPEGLVGETYWLHTWMEEFPASAWGWFEQHVASSPAVAGELVKAFAKMAQDCKWVKQPADALRLTFFFGSIAFLASPSRHLALRLTLKTWECLGTSLRSFVQESRTYSSSQEGLRRTEP